VNSVLAVPTRSEAVETFISRMGDSSDAAEFESKFFKTIQPSSRLKRFAMIDEVASMIVYLCSPLASAITGSAIREDGGVARAILDTFTD
jgi:enoyl-[acyl-carrier-protein] reductase (NADH)